MEAGMRAERGQELGGLSEAAALQLGYCLSRWKMLAKGESGSALRSQRST